MTNGHRPHFEIEDRHVREEDARVTGWSETFVRPDFGQHGAELLRTVRSVRESLARSRDYASASTSYVSVRVPPERAIYQEKSRLRQVGLEVVALTDRPDTGIARVSKDHYDELESRILRYATQPGHPYRSYLSVIESIDPVPGEIKIDPAINREANTPQRCILHLYSGLSPAERAAISLTVRNYVAEIGRGEAAIRAFSNGITTVEAELTPEEMVRTGYEFSTIRRITPNRLFFTTDSVALGAVPPNVTVAQPLAGTAVAVVDTGIHPDSPYVAPPVVARLPQLPPGAVAAENKHGTFVASRVLYGDLIEHGIRNGQLVPACHLVDVPVFGILPNGTDADVPETHLAEAIDRAIPNLPANARVVNISLGTDVPIVDHAFSLVANVIDHLVHERDIVVVVSAGNIRDRALVRTYPAQVHHPSWRIDPPGEALLALTVGGIAHFTDTNTISAAREMSAFSRRGPGADGGVSSPVT